MSRAKQLVPYTLGEELCNAISHGVGAALSIAGLVVLLLSAQNVWEYVSFSIYGASMVFLFLMSCLYHALTHQTAKYIMRIFDHTAIFLLIAGTYTPFTLITLRQQVPVVGWTVFGMVWAAAVIGIVLNAISIERFKRVSMVCYIGSGWCIIAALYPLIQCMEPGGLMLLIGGGVCYTAGLLFYGWKKVRYMHSVWHLFVLAGAVLHYLCVLLYV